MQLADDWGFAPFVPEQTAGKPRAQTRYVYTLFNIVTTTITQSQLRVVTAHPQLLPFHPFISLSHKPPRGFILRLTKLLHLGKSAKTYLILCGDRG